jgi:branched-chain amino acid transport system permease protein
LEVTDIFIYIVGASILALVVIGSIATITQARYSSRAWFDLVMFGVTLGSIYALIALVHVVYGFSV